MRVTFSNNPVFITFCDGGGCVTRIPVCARSKGPPSIKLPARHYLRARQINDRQCKSSQRRLRAPSTAIPPFNDMSPIAPTRHAVIYVYPVGAYVAIKSSGPSNELMIMMYRIVELAVLFLLAIESARKIAPAGFEMHASSDSFVIIARVLGRVRVIINHYYAVTTLTAVPITERGISNGSKLHPVWCCCHAQDLSDISFHSATPARAIST